MTDDKTTKEHENALEVQEEGPWEKELSSSPTSVYSRSELDHAVIEIPEGGGQPTFTPVPPPFEGGSSGPMPLPQPITLDHIAETSHQMAAGHAGLYGHGLITITYSADGAYRVCCNRNVDITTVIGFLFRSILSLQKGTEHPG
jgi:hypothetical protein